MNWYIVQAYSGFEKKVVESIKDELKKHKLSETCPKILLISLSEIGVGLSAEPKKPLTFCKFFIIW